MPTFLSHRAGPFPELSIILVEPILRTRGRPTIANRTIFRPDPLYTKNGQPMLLYLHARTLGRIQAARASRGPNKGSGWIVLPILLIACQLVLSTPSNCQSTRLSTPSICLYLVGTCTVYRLYHICTCWCTLMHHTWYRYRNLAQKTSSSELALA